MNVNLNVNVNGRRASCMKSSMCNVPAKVFFLSVVGKIIGGQRRGLHSGAGILGFPATRAEHAAHATSHTAVGKGSGDRTE